MKNKRKKYLMFFFVVYMLILTKLIMLKFYNWGVIQDFCHEWNLKDAIANIKKTNLIPISSIYNDLFNINTPDTHYYRKIVFYNSISFIPYGFMLPLVFPKINTLKKIIISSSMLSLCYEALQAITCLGVFDIDDIILNTFGGIIGFGLVMTFICIREFALKKFSNTIDQ